MRLNHVFVALVALVLMSNCSSNDREEAFNRPKIRLMNGVNPDVAPLDVEIFNGEELRFRIENVSNVFQIEIRNNTNANVVVTPLIENSDTGSFLIASLVGQDQTTAFDVFAGDQNLGRIALALKVPFKLLVEGNEVDGVFNVAPNGSLPKQLKILTNTNQEIANFNYRNVSILEGFESSFDFEINSGDDFYFFPNVTQAVTQKQHLGLYYFSEALGRRVLVKPIAIAAADRAGCTRIENRANFGFTSSTEKFIVVQNQILGIELESQFRGDISFFYTENNLVCLKNESSSNEKYMEYIYENGQLKTTKKYARENTLTDEVDHTYNAAGDKLQEVLKTKPRTRDEFVFITEYNYSDYKNGVPELTTKRLLNTTRPGAGIEGEYTYKTIYDTQGRRLRDSISIRGAAYVLDASYSYYDNETIVLPYEALEGKTFKAFPVVKTYTKYKQENDATVVDEAKTLSRSKNSAGEVIKGYALKRPGITEPRDAAIVRLVEFENITTSCRTLN